MVCIDQINSHKKNDKNKTTFQVGSAIQSKNNVEFLYKNNDYRLVLNVQGRLQTSFQTITINPVRCTLR